MLVITRRYKYVFRTATTKFTGDIPVYIIQWLWWRFEENGYFLHYLCLQAFYQDLSKVWTCLNLFKIFKNKNKKTIASSTLMPSRIQCACKLHSNGLSHSVCVKAALVYPLDYSMRKRSTRMPSLIQYA